ncbi:MULTISPECIES: type II toxin-antitoxin system HicA family toxin [unclassified Rathayibacter]|uniref:type II toxin-antitoxin system HicA family toxin n=1 Tax=unclassified Rathayibacter TaxID=2609250 RepID=UPI000A417289|nr:MULTISPECIES: type II toxin-antitoxin system HicA family toxin [unclassified Rathayibacter]
MVKEVKQREVERFLEASGWRLLREKGPHNVWGSPDGTQVIAIPRHGTVSPGVVTQIIKAQPGSPASWR